MTIEGRVKRLEKELTTARRHIRFLLAGAGLAGACMVLLAAFGGAPPLGEGSATVQEEITARSFKLVDDKGTVRGKWAFNPDGSPGLVLYDENGSHRVVLGVTTDGGPSFLSLSDENGSRRVMLHVTMDGCPGLVLSDENGSRRVVLGVATDGSPGLGLYDENGSLFWVTPTPQ